MIYSTDENKPYKIICGRTNNSKEDIENRRINITIEIPFEDWLYMKIKEYLNGII